MRLLFNSLNAAFLVDILFLKQYCSVTRMLFVCRFRLNLLCTDVSITLEKTVNNERGLSFFTLFLSPVLQSGSTTALLRWVGKIPVYSV
jgi:hypothetical protein